MPETVIQTHGLTRVYGQKLAVNQINLTVLRGSVTALIGRNGSGKTTAIRMLLGLVPPTRGHATVLGCDSRQLTPEIRARVGYLSESHFAYHWMKLREAAAFQAGTFPKWNQTVFDGIIDHLGLNTESKVGSLSRGERAGLCLALTLAPEPELLVLDDPALGLDPVARRALVEAMLAVTQHRDRTILFSSHLLDDVERVADHVAIIDQGVLRVQASVDEFCSRVSVWRLTFDRFPDRLPEIPGLIHTRYIDNQIQLTVANSDDATAAVIASIGANRAERTEAGFQQAVIDYLTVRGGTGSLLKAVGAPAAERETVAVGGRSGL